MNIPAMMPKNQVIKSDEDDTGTSKGTSRLGEQSCDGRKRYAAEHWVHSHPDVLPCDLHTDSKFTWGYTNVPYSNSWPKRLKVAPRFTLKTYVRWPECAGRGMTVQQRLVEYDHLYPGKRPGPNWYGWALYPNETTSFDVVDYRDTVLPYYLLYWEWLSPDLKRLAETLGYEAAIWDNLRHPTSLEGSNWNSFAPNVQRMLFKLGYTKESWGRTTVVVHRGRR